MSYLLSYASGVIGYGLSDDLDVAMDQAVQRCEVMQQAATIVNRETYQVVASVEPVGPGLYKAQKAQ
ncbi:hypothetical protein [Pseudoduganella lutea]|uniref:Uncharacterized protein n=1 Tax=Pseudoduganella lutea TaxID=321985 RepID=A0A4P6L5M7_9BURK|nr:hypothetical protein [Pseudoduganella lutea]QBE66827.1 hypothetical protein EWM63_30855 [Pseudoduganella lutea]